MAIFYLNESHSLYETYYATWDEKIALPMNQVRWYNYWCSSASCSRSNRLLRSNSSSLHSPSSLPFLSFASELLRDFRSFSFFLISLSLRTSSTSVDGCKVHLPLDTRIKWTKSWVHTERLLSFFFLFFFFLFFLADMGGSVSSRSLLITTGTFSSDLERDRDFDLDSDLNIVDTWKKMNGEKYSVSATLAMIRTWTRKTCACASFPSFCSFWTSSDDDRTTPPYLAGTPEQSRPRINRLSPGCKSDKPWISELAPIPVWWLQMRDLPPNSDGTRPKPINDLPPSP